MGAVLVLLIILIFGILRINPYILPPPVSKKPAPVKTEISEKITVDSDEQVPEPDAVSINTDEEKLLLYRQLWKELEYETVKESLPEISELRKGTTADGASEAYINVSILGFPAAIIFSFNDNTLKEIYYRFKPENKRETDEIYSRLKEFYKSKLGNYSEEEIVEEPGSTILVSDWDAKDSRIIVEKVSPAYFLITISVVWK